MTTKYIIFKKPDNGVSIVIPSPEWTSSIEELASITVPSGTPWKIVDAKDIPTDRTFRDAWEWQE